MCWCQELHEEFMLEWVQVFSEVVCNIIGRFNVSYNKLPLTYAISHPVEAHVDCLGAFLFIESVAMPIAQVLSHMIMVGGWG